MILAVKSGDCLGEGWIEFGTVIGKETGSEFGVDANTEPNCKQGLDRDGEPGYD